MTPFAKSVPILATTGITRGYIPSFVRKYLQTLYDLELKDWKNVGKTLKIQYNRSTEECWIDIESSQVNINVNGMILLNLAESSVMFLKRPGSWAYQP